MKKLLFIILAIIITGSLFLVGCGEPAGPEKSGGTLRILDMRLPTGALGWPAKTQGQDTYFLQPCVETLFRSDKSMKPVPLLATDYKIASDLSSITLTLREGVKFHDGTDFNAEACKFNLDAVMAAKVPGTTGWTSVEVIDNKTVKINIGTWENLIMGNLAGRAGMMVSPKSIQDNGEDWANTNVVGTGPFKFSKFERDTLLEFVRFDDYWQEGKPHLDAIQYIAIPDLVNQMNTFKVGDAELIQPWAGFVLGELKDLPGTEFIYSHSGCFILYPDDANPDSPLSNPLVRQAIEYAIDKEALMNVAGFGVFEAAYQVPVPDAIGFIPDLPKRMYDPQKARELLDQAGYSEGFDCTLTITINAPDIQDAQVAIQGFLEAVNIRASLEYAEPAKYADYMASGWFKTMIYSPAYAAGNFLSSVQTYYMVPGYYVSLKGPSNLKDLYDAAINTAEVDRALVEKVTRAMYDDCSLIPISYMGTGQVFKDTVHDLGFGKYSSQMNWEPENAWMD